MKISVTAEDIKKADDYRKHNKDYKATCDCPVALALVRHGVSFRGVSRRRIERFGICSFWLPYEVTRFIENFDAHCPVEPIEFEIDIPEKETI